MDLIEKKPVTLEAGKRYICRNGKIVRMTKFFDFSEPYYQGDNFSFYTPDGYVREDKWNGEWDIVQECAVQFPALNADLKIEGRQVFVPQMVDKIALSLDNRKTPIEIVVHHEGNPLRLSLDMTTRTFQFSTGDVG